MVFSLQNILQSIDFQAGNAVYKGMTMQTNTSVLKKYDEAVRLNPDSAEAYFKRGFAKALKYQDPSALVDYDEAIRLNPNFAEAYFHRACLKDYLALHEPRIADCYAGLRSAISDFDEVLRIDPNFSYLSDTYYRRGNAKYNLNQYEAAIADYDEALKVGPGDPEILSERQMVKNILNSYKERIAELDENIKQNPNDVKTIKIRGETKAFLGHRQEAKADFKTILDLTNNAYLIVEIERHLKELDNNDYWYQYRWFSDG